MIHKIIRIILKIPRIISFLLFYIKEIILANIRVAHDVLTPKHYMKPGVIAIKMDAEKDMEILTLNNLITMTPGTISLDVSTDKKVIYVHAMYIDDPNDVRREIKQGLEKKILEVYR